MMREWKLTSRFSKASVLGAMLVLLLVSRGVTADESASRKVFVAKDTFVDPKDDNAAAQRRLDWVKWQPKAFEVTCVAPAKDGALAKHAAEAGYDALVYFPSPHPTDERANDTVVMEWFAPRNASRQVKRGPAMVVLHILAGRMVVARMFARAFAQRGIHAFVMHMPHYGLRKVGGKRPNAKVLLAGVRQAVADARRARDAVNALPNIQRDAIGIQGTSLGGFICTATASLDGTFKPVFPTLCGGNLQTLFRDGKKEVASIREHLKKEGITPEQLKRMLEQLEPNSVAHRMDAKVTWMFNAEQDEVIPAANAHALAKAIGLPKERHKWMSGGHVSCIIHLPVIVELMAGHVHAIHSPKLKEDAAP